MELQKAIENVLDFAKKRYRLDFILNEEQQIINKETLWFIPFIEKEEKERTSWLGATKGCIIDKVSGEISQPGSAYSLEMWIWGFELGFRDERLDLTITKINNEKQAIDILEKFGVGYIKPKLEKGTILKNFEFYTQAELKEKISNLPCTFKNQGLSIKLWVLRELHQCKAFEYKVKSTDNKYDDIYGDLIDENNLIQ